MNLNYLLSGFIHVSSYLENSLRERIIRYSQDKIKKAFDVPNYSISTLYWKFNAAVKEGPVKYNESELSFYRSYIIKTAKSKIRKKYKFEIARLVLINTRENVFKLLQDDTNSYLGFKESLQGNSLLLYNSIDSSINTILSTHQFRTPQSSTIERQKINNLTRAISSEIIETALKTREYITTKKLINNEFSVCVDSNTIKNIPAEYLVPISICIDLEKNVITPKTLEI